MSKSERTGTSRRSVIKAGAWATPAVVVAAAAPAHAASGPAAVTTVVQPTTDTAGALPVSIDFVNRNTRDTGLTTAIVGFTPTTGSVATAAPVDVTPGWSYLGNNGSTSEPRFSFSRATGIDGAPPGGAPATTTLEFTVTVVPNALGISTGTIDVVVVPGSGNVSGGTGIWG